MGYPFSGGSRISQRRGANPILSWLGSTPSNSGGGGGVTHPFLARGYSPSSPCWGVPHPVWSMAVVDLRGTRGMCAPPSGPKFLHFHAVFTKNWPNNRLVPPLGYPLARTGWVTPPSPNPGDRIAVTQTSVLRNALVKSISCCSKEISELNLILLSWLFQKNICDNNVEEVDNALGGWCVQIFLSILDQWD